MDKYVTSEGDTMDDIAWNYYGSTANRVVEQVLVANPGLADLGPVLPAGVTITLPAVAAPAEVQGVKLWD
jgi:phage tail protein X